MSCSTLKRLCKQARLCWKRVRRSLRGKRDPDLFAQSQQQLAVLIEQAKQEQIDLVYFDESGFTLEPCIPYAWQPVGETIEVPCAKSNRLNVLGFMNKNGAFQSWVFEQSSTSAVVVAWFDAFAQSLKCPAVLVIDNATIHTSHEFKDNSERWQQLGLTIVTIAPYSPELNTQGKDAKVNITAKDDTPKEGDTNAEELVFRNGRWHRENMVNRPERDNSPGHVQLVSDMKEELAFRDQNRKRVEFFEKHQSRQFAQALINNDHEKAIDDIYRKYVTFEDAKNIFADAKNTGLLNDLTLKKLSRFCNYSDT